MNPEVQKGLDAIHGWLSFVEKSLVVEPNITTEEKKQLQAVNRSIEQLKKLGVSIPDDLRNLKLRLTALDCRATPSGKVKGHLEALDELIESLSELKGEAKRIRHSVGAGGGSKGTKTHFGTRVADLMEAGLLSTEAHLELQWKKDGEIYEGKLLIDGRIAVRTSSGWTEYDSLSTAAARMAGRSLNGWDTWRLVESSGRRIPLTEIRRRYMEASEP